MSKNDKAPSPYFRVHETVPHDGIYRAYHNDHRTSHEVTLIGGEAFPPCKKCGNDVHFEVLREVGARTHDPDFDFKIRIYELPHPTEEEDEQKTA